MSIFIPKKIFEYYFSQNFQINGKEMDYIFFNKNLYNKSKLHRK